MVSEASAAILTSPLSWQLLEPMREEHPHESVQACLSEALLDPLALKCWVDDQDQPWARMTLQR